MRRLTFAVPGDLSTPTGGYAYDRRLIEELRRMDWRVDVLNLGERFPYPSAATLTAANAELRALDDAPTIIDGLAYGVMAEVGRTMSKPPIALVHHPLALESGLSGELAARFSESERSALANARAVIVTSPATARTLVQDYAVPDELITIAEPGVDRRPIPQRKPSAEIALLSVGATSPRKGYDVLLKALASLTDLKWRLKIVGALDRNPDCARDLMKLASDLSLAERVTFAGNLTRDALDAQYDSADVFVLASRFEGYGMAYTEAVAAGLPIIATTAGAIPDTVPRDAGILVPPGDPEALANALRRVIEDATLRAQLSRGAQAAADTLPTWQGCAARVAALLERML